MEKMFAAEEKAPNTNGFKCFPCYVDAVRARLGQDSKWDRVQLEKSTHTCGKVERGEVEKLTIVHWIDEWDDEPTWKHKAAPEEAEEYPPITPDMVVSVEPESSDRDLIAELILEELNKL